MIFWSLSHARFNPRIEICNAAVQLDTAEQYEFSPKNLEKLSSNFFTFSPIVSHLEEITFSTASDSLLE